MVRGALVAAVALMLMPIAAAGGQWNGAQWNGGQWNGAQWNSGPVEPWGFDAVGMPSWWSPVSAPRDALACIVDSGIDASHPILAPHVVATRAFTGASIDDPEGHGTHVAGLVVAIGAPRLAIAKVLDADGRGATADVVAALDWCRGLGSDVILLAMSEDAPTPAFEDAVKRAAKDAVVVAAAGNGGPCASCLSSPASLERALAVGASDRSGALAPFSAQGAHLDLLAPGVEIVSTFPGGAWRAGTGTSQAAAFVAGAAALAAAVHPDWSAHEIARALEKGAAGGVLDVSASL